MQKSDLVSKMVQVSNRTSASHRGPCLGHVPGNLRPQFIGGAPSKKAHPWLIPLYEDLNDGAFIGLEFKT